MIESRQPVSPIATQAVRNNARDHLVERLKFEKLLAELASNFVNAPPGALDDELRKAQSRICQHLGLDRSVIWQFFDSDLRYLQITHLYQAVSGPPAVSPTDNQRGEPSRKQSPDGTWGFNRVLIDNFFPWTAGQIREKKPVVIENIDSLPPQASTDRQFLTRYETKSSVIMPLIEGDTVIGMVSMATLREHRKFPEWLIDQFRTMALIFCHAIARIRVDNVIRDSETRLALAAESARAGVWELDLATGVIHASPKALDLLGLNPGESLDLEKIGTYIHPEDIEQFRYSIGSCRQTDAHVRVDVRVLLPDGSSRWVNASMVRSQAAARDLPGRILGISVDITERKQLEFELERRLAENAELKHRLETENLYQREEFKTVSELAEIVGQSVSMQKVYRQIAQVGPTQSPVLITGETGTGKELVSRAIHTASPRKNRTMVTVNCATLPGSLIESELFGREKGAYTGALTRQAGRFELANGGTIFLDEIGELSVELQGKLLRVLQEGEFERLGNPKTIKVDVRIIAATNRNLIEAVNAGAFRKDLYYRLSVFPIELPPLRDRTDDIPLLVWAFVDEFNRKMGKRIVSIPAKTMDLLKSYSWPGNVRELRNTIEHAMIVSVGDKLDLQLPEARQSLDSSNMTLEEVMHRSILQTLKKTDWRIKGPRGAATILGLRPSTLYTKMKKLGIPLRLEKTP